MHEQSTRTDSDEVLTLILIADPQMLPFMFSLAKGLPVSGIILCVPVAAYAQPKADAGSDPTNGATSTNGAGSRPTPGAKPRRHSGRQFAIKIQSRRAAIRLRVMRKLGIKEPNAPQNLRH